jgi:transcriptional/translational regulatory protein YebC/TACO1
LIDAFGEIDFDVDEIQFLPQGSTPITADDDIEMFNKFIDMLNDLDDVQNIYHDAEIESEE